MANPKEAKCTDGLKLMETVQFLCHRNLDFKAKNKEGKSFLDLVTGRDKNLLPVLSENRKLTGRKQFLAQESERCETNCQKIYRS